MARTRRWARHADFATRPLIPDGHELTVGEPRVLAEIVHRFCERAQAHVGLWRKSADGDAPRRIEALLAEALGELNLVRYAPIGDDQDDKRADAGDVPPAA